jgi:hypothetical protein
VQQAHARRAYKCLTCEHAWLSVIRRRSCQLKQITILFKLQELPKGFEVSPTQHSCTRGLWMWSVPIPSTDANGRPCNVVRTGKTGYDWACAFHGRLGGRRGWLLKQCNAVDLQDLPGELLHVLLTTHALHCYAPMANPCLT